MKAFQHAMAAGCVALLLSAGAIGAEPIGVNEPGVNRAARGAEPIGVNEPGVNRAARDAEPIGVNEPGVNRTARGAKPIGIQEEGVNRTARDAEPIGVNEPGVNRAAERKGGNRGYVVGKGGVARIRAESDAGADEGGEEEEAAGPDPR